MDEKNLLPVLFTVIGILLGICIFLVVYFKKREKKLVSEIQLMIEKAADGSFSETQLDESKRSIIESILWNYLSGQQTAYQNLLKEKEQIQGFLSDISHQAITPISNLLLYTQLLEEWAKNHGDYGPEVEEEFTAIKEQAKKLDFFMEALLKLSRLETGILKLNPKKQKVLPVLSAVCQQFESRAEQKQVQLSMEETEETALFDLKWTIEAVANIVENAIKYTPLGGKISICVKSYSFFVCIRITDTGIGIAETEQANVFTRFYRSSRVSETPGLGIGLYLAREVMKRQNGYIKLNSQIEKGSCFSLFLLKDEMSQK